MYFIINITFLFFIFQRLSSKGNAGPRKQKGSQCFPILMQQWFKDVSSTVCVLDNIERRNLNFFFLFSLHYITPFDG